jgi:hypothetical protein
MTTATTAKKPVEHNLKQRAGATYGECTCGRWDIHAKAATDVQAQFDLHANRYAPRQ